ncbi:MAG: hypothetical protein WCK98_04880 [bacterium]
MSITISSISQVRQEFLQLAKNLENTNEEVVVVSNSKPLLVLVPYLKWQKQQKDNEQRAWAEKSKLSFSYDTDELDNFDPLKLKPID